MLYSLARSILFSLPPELAHDSALTLARLSPLLGQLTGTTSSSRLSLKVGGNRWKNPFALAAGLDKNAQALPFFAAQGFGAIECGTITLKPQLGNQRPRLFRYPQEASLRNSMGFPNHGLIEIAQRMSCFEGTDILGANIGKNKDSSPEESIRELGLMVQELNPHADYFVINVSSPNTPGLRALQETGYLRELFTQLKEISQRDLYLKVSPDLEEKKIRDLVRLLGELNLCGIIATNTTIMPERGEGGVSGTLLAPKAQRVREIILQEEVPIELIGVGGFASFEDVKNFWTSGGKALQIYTAYVYQGPALLRQLHQKCLELLDRNQLADVQTFFDLPLKERREILNDP
jgi:dihydroorotate dehydrogenase